MGTPYWIILRELCASSVLKLQGQQEREKTGNGNESSGKNFNEWLNFLST